MWVGGGGAVDGGRYIKKYGPASTTLGQEDNEANQMPLPFRHRIQNSIPSGLSPSTLPFRTQRLPTKMHFCERAGNKYFVALNVNKVVTSSSPREHDTLTQCWLNVGPSSATLAQL